jgi:molybdopterin-containing oxidoreductase family iron-sulfur binding subunit
VFTFGNLADPESAVYKLKREPVGFQYGVLAELNTRPRTSYLAKINNPQPAPHAGRRPGEPSGTDQPGCTGNAGSTGEPSGTGDAGRAGDDPGGPGRHRAGPVSDGPRRRW